jgi:hypothetical protein
MAIMRFGRSKIKIKVTSDKLVDLLGLKFGRLTVLARTFSSTSGAARWVCGCDCDPKVRTVVRADSLRSGRTLSCGCLAIEATLQRALDRPKAEPKPRKPRAKRRPPVVFADAALAKEAARLRRATIMREEFPDAEVVSKAR